MLSYGQVFSGVCKIDQLLKPLIGTVSFLKLTTRSWVGV
jgi:hypothetical protein